MDETFEAELERRLALLEDPSSGEGVLPPLPLKDLLISLAALVTISVALLWWSI